MKKLMVVVALLITVLCFSSMASAREVNFKVDYNAFNKVYSGGETVITTVYVKKAESRPWKQLEANIDNFDIVTEGYTKYYADVNSEIKGVILSYNDKLYRSEDYAKYDLIFKTPDTTGMYDINISSPYLDGGCTIKVKVLNKKAPTVKYTFKNNTLTLKWNAYLKKSHGDGHNYELQFKYNDGKWCNYVIGCNQTKCVITNGDWLNGWEKGTYKFRVRDKHCYGKTNWSKPITIKIK